MLLLKLVINNDDDNINNMLNTLNLGKKHPVKLRDWFTTAQTYLLPKNKKNIENPQNYRQIACLSTSFSR